MTPAPLLPWPDKHDYAVGYINGMIDWRDGRCEIAYERAMKEAAMQRLRVAIGWLEEIARTDTPSDYPNEYGGYGGSMAKQALEKIGDLPPHPGEGE